MPDEIRLSSGQKAQFHDGVVEVVSEKGRRYRLTVEQASGGELRAVCRDYEQLILFLHQTERLHYELRSLERDD